MMILTPVTHDIGAFEVRRTLPAKGRTMVGPFIFVDQFGPAQFDLGTGMDVRPHPHINLATVTYLFDGAIEHRDSLGTHAVIEPGALNLMTAGKGIVHSERSPMAERRQDGTGYDGRISGMQTWLALPDGREEIDPAFEHIAADALPLVEDGQASARVIMGSLWGATAPTTQHSPTIYADLLLSAGASVPIDADAGEERGLILALGAAELDGLAMIPHCLYVLEPGQNVRLKATANEIGAEARVMLLGGDGFLTKRHAWWNFVSSSRDRINQAKEDWRNGRFPMVPGDEAEHIPLPDGKPLTNSDG